MSTKRHLYRLLVGLYVCLAVELSYAAAAVYAQSITIGYSGFSSAFGPFWTTIENQVGKNHGVDLKAIYTGRVRPQQLLTSGEVPFVIGSGTGAVTSHVLGIKDQVIALTFVNKVGGSIFARSDIKTYRELKGKTIATGRPGGLLDLLARFVIRREFGLVPDRDVRLLPIGEPGAMLQALERGVVNAAALTVPNSFIANKMGFRELLDFDKVGITYPYNSVIALRQTLVKDPVLVEKVLKSMVEGLFLFKTDKERSLSIMGKYMRGAGKEMVAEAYQYTTAGLEQVPAPSLREVQTALEIVQPEFPQAKQTDPSQIFDASFVRRIEQSGFIKSLYKK
jgi:ABC-type nitrate/sulfonate/bicarbonate transport system substrate-binding protein